MAAALQRSESSSRQVPKRRGGYRMAKKTAKKARRKKGTKKKATKKKKAKKK